MKVNVATNYSTELTSQPLHHYFYFLFFFFFSFLTKPIFFGDAVSSAAMSCMVLSLNFTFGLCLVSFITAYFQPSHPQHVVPGKITKVI